MSKIILAIESSCDETACAIVKDKTELLANVVSSQISTHKKFGGVIPEVASRIHVENISTVIDEALENAKLSMKDIDAIAITQGPGLIGSLHVGVMAAKTIAWFNNLPLIPVHHIAGHIYANALIDGLTFPLLALVVSGGHTELVYMSENYSFEVLGSTQDDAIGEAYDKVARVLGLSYPGGPIVDRLAKTGKVNANYKLPICKASSEYDFSFSGTKSAVLQLIARENKAGREIVVEDVCYSFQETALSDLVNKTNKAVQNLDVKHVVVAGGVAANSRLRELLSQQAEAWNDVKLTLPPLWCCTDNAAMIGVAASFGIDKIKPASLDLSATPSMDLE